MRAIVITIILFASLVVAGSSTTNEFVVVTNNWSLGNFSNVLRYAQRRIDSNSNDVVAAYILLDYNVNFSSNIEISNSINQVMCNSMTVTNARFRAMSELLRPYYFRYQREILPNFSAADLADRNAKATKPGREMPSTYILQMLWAEGLW